MADESHVDLLPNSPDLLMLANNKQDAFDYRRRRHDDWNENYTLYRDKVQVNRLEQRQSVNLPIMKTVLRTLMKDVDDMPVLYFENLDNDKKAETFKNEYWKVVGDEDHGKFEIQDIIDKRQVFHFGRSYDQWQIIDGMPVMNIVDVMDILVPRYNDPTSIDNNEFLIHTHIFVPIDDLEANKEYDQQAIKDLKEWYGTNMGLIKQADNQQMMQEKNKKLQDLGLTGMDSPILGKTYVELTLHFVKMVEDGYEKQIWLYVEAENRRILMKKRLEEVIGETKDHYWRNHYPYDSWADDIDKQDWYTDGVADIVRTPNKVANAWYSQMVENRTLRNFNMMVYNSNIDGFVPQTYEPRPFGWYGIPVPPGSNLGEVFQRLETPDLSESLDEIQFVITMIEKASGATSTEQGATEQRQITLGEVQLALGEAKERIKGMSKFYTQVWKERGVKFIKLLEAAPEKIDAVMIYKKGKQTDAIYSREIDSSDWMTATGYRCKVWSREERAQQNDLALQKLNAAKSNMPDNPVVDDKFKRKLLEFADFTPDETVEAMKFEDMKKQQMMAQVQNGMMGGGQPVPGQLPGQPPAQLPGQPAPQLPANVGGIR